jgi:hypothetical protein
MAPDVQPKARGGKLMVVVYAKYNKGYRAVHHALALASKRPTTETPMACGKYI